MPTLQTTLNDKAARLVEIPSPKPDGKTAQKFWWCPTTPGFGLRVSSSGDKAFISQRRVNGKEVKRTLGSFSGGGSITTDTARKLFSTINNELHLGIDRVEIKREEKAAQTVAAYTFGQALEDYVEKKRRTKDGLPLKSRTKHDYLEMIVKGGVAAGGKPYLNGPLYPLASKGLTSITADDMRAVDAIARKRSKRRADYAMQVLRAVLNWHGTTIPDSPLAKTTPGKDRIVISGAKPKAKPIPLAQLGDWWNAATRMSEKGRMPVSRIGADGLRLMLLTGLRPGEVFGSKDQPGIFVRDVNLRAAMVTTLDTKNRNNFDVLLSKQALEILAHHCAGKLPMVKVFNVTDTGKTMASINKDALVTGITPHCLRHTFASIAESLTTEYTVKRMINHIHETSATGGYIGKTETQLSDAWQMVANFIVESGEKTDKVASEKVAQR